MCIIYLIEFYIYIVKIQSEMPVNLRRMKTNSDENK